jgi:hypothetical protein
MYPTSSQFQSDTYSNVPNMSLMFTLFTPIFGTGSFVIQPASPGEVQDGYPTIPYLSLEAVLYEAQSSNPSVAPVNIQGGSNTGQQVISSNQTTLDSTGTPRTLSGYQATGG